MEKHEKIISVMMGVVLIAMFVVLVVVWHSRPEPYKIPYEEAEYITKELHRRAAGSCVLSTTETGYVCTEQSGKRFYIHIK